MRPDDITGEIIDAAMHIHREIGPGLFESIYETLLAYEVDRRGLAVERQKLITLRYRELEIRDAFKADMIVDGQVIVEVKSLEKLAPVHRKQLLTYLRLSQLQIGLLINFGAPLLRDGLKRVVNGITLDGSSRLLVNRARTP